MTSGMEITSSIKVPLDQPVPYENKYYTTYPLSATDVDNECGVLPYMARMHSPIRISRTPATIMGMKRKSRVTDTTKSAIFNYKPLRRTDHTSMLKFRAPDATLPTLQYISPWLSVTKTDYQDPRYSGDFSSSSELPFGLFGRSYTDVSIDLSRKNTPSISRSDSLKKSDISSQQQQRASMTRETSAKTVSSLGRRVQIVEPEKEKEREDEEEIKCAILEPVNSSPTPSVKTKVSDIKEPKGRVNYYSGYLPPELSDKIAEKLKITNEDTNSDKKAAQSSLRAQFYKPLVGDRTLYMHESYPTQPKILQSDIDQMRLASRKRFLQSHGQAPVHFSALKDYGITNRSKQRGSRLDEAVREQQRQTQSAKVTRQPAMATSIEVFQQQRDRTYQLQSLAREMINK